MNRRMILTLGLFLLSGMIGVGSLCAAENFAPAMASRFDQRRTEAGRLILLADPKLDGYNIGLRIEGDTATVFGIFPTESLAQYAITQSKTLPGIREVIGEYEVIAPPDRAIERVKRDVERGLTAPLELPPTAAIPVKRPIKRTTHKRPTGQQMEPPIDVRLPFAKPEFNPDRPAVQLLPPQMLPEG